MPTHNRANPPAAECCPIAIGEVCWDDGVSSGRAFVIRLADGALEYVDQAGSGLIPAGDIVLCVDDEPWTDIAGVITRSETNAAGAIAANAASVTVVNVGANAGVLNGIPLAAGESLTISAYEDPVNRRFVRVPAITFDATGTTFHITRQS